MRYLLTCLLIAPVVFLNTNTVWAQSQLGTGAISGAITDPAGMAVPEASVTVTNTDTGLVRRITTEGAGLFSVPVLPIGQYVVRVEKSGFSTWEQKDLTINVGSTITLQVQLTIGPVASVVEVKAEAPILDTTRTAEVTLITREQINELPINGRRVDQFALLSPGVTRDGRFGLLSYNGVSGVFNNYTVEGNDDNQAYFAEAVGRTRIASNISANAIQCGSGSPQAARAYDGRPRRASNAITYRSSRPLATRSTNEAAQPGVAASLPCRNPVSPPNPRRSCTANPSLSALCSHGLAVATCQSVRDWRTNEALQGR